MSEDAVGTVGNGAVELCIHTYRDIFENAHEGICVCQDGRVCFANPAFIAMTGYSAGELYSQSLLVIVHPEDHSRVIAEYTARMQGNPKGTTYEFRGITKAGEVRWLMMSAIRVDWMGKPAALDFVSDIHELKLAREKEERRRIEETEERSRLEALQSANAELEKTVAERTRELKAANSELNERIAERDRLIEELNSAIANIRQLEGILPICASCKAIRDAEGKWVTIEDYITGRSKTEFTHGICPKCVDKIYPDFKNLK